MFICKHCSVEFDTTDKPKGWMANHSRWCVSNPKRQDYVDALKGRDNLDAMLTAKKQSGKTNQYSKARVEGRDIPESPLKGKTNLHWKGRSHTEESKEKIRQAALASSHRRLKKGTVMYKGVLLDSSWELALAQRLDELQIKWIRPEPIPWTDDKGLTHNYFADFYLEEFDLYLDPKNPYAIKVQKDKFDKLHKLYPNIRIIDSLEKCRSFRI